MMPFCRECGKQIEESWKVCPHCTAPIQIPITDSVIMVDNSTTINNDTEVISSAMKSATKCPNCNSLSPTQYACSKCRNIGFCDICVGGELASKRTKLLQSVWGGTDGAADLNALIESDLPLNVSLCNSCYQDEFTKKFPKCFNCDVNHKSNSHSYSSCHFCENLTCSPPCQSQHYQVCNQVVEIRAEINNSIEGFWNEVEPFGDDYTRSKGYNQELNELGRLIHFISTRTRLFTASFPERNSAQDSFKELLSSLEKPLGILNIYFRKLSRELRVQNSYFTRINDVFTKSDVVNCKGVIDYFKTLDPIKSINEYRNISRKIIEKSNLENIDDFDLLKVLIDEDFAREMNYYNIFTVPAGGSFGRQMIWDLMATKKLIQSKEDQK